MVFLRVVITLCLWFTSNLQVFAAVTDNTQLAVWANEAIIATFTYDYQNFLTRQKEIATYFTADGWIRYTKALQDANLPETVKKNAYYVSAVATMPPEIKVVKEGSWQAIMPVLVVYKNPQNIQKQTLAITLTFIKSPIGVRGLAVTNLQAAVLKTPCKCDNDASLKAVA